MSHFLCFTKSLIVCFSVIMFCINKKSSIRPSRLCFKRNPAESRAKIWRHNAYKQPIASAAVQSLANILSFLNAHNFITRWYTSLIKFCIRIHFNIVQTLACVKVLFGRQGYAEHQSGGWWSVSINAHKS